MAAVKQVWKTRRTDIHAQWCTEFDTSFLICITHSKGSDGVRRVTKLGETGCCGLGMTQLGERVYGGLTV